MARPVGKQIRAMLNASETLGKPATSKELAKVAQIDMIASNLTRICKRAIKYGLMDETDEGLFVARPGWRALCVPGVSKKVKPITKVKHRIPRVANSVFQLGAL